MARPTKTNLDYFPFECGFFEDEKVAAIAGEFGIKGELATVKLLCAVYQNGYFVEWSEMLQMKLLRALPGVSLELLNQIVIRLVKWGFFDPNLFGSVKILTSRGIQKRYFEATKRWKRETANLPYLLVNVAETPVNVTLTPVNVAEIPQNKIKSKLNKNTPPTPHGGVGGVFGGGGGVQQQEDCFESRIEEMKKSPARLDAFAKMHSKSREQILTYIERFALYIRGSDIKINPASIGSFFSSWLRREIQREDENEQKQHILSHRRGVDSNSKKQKNWDASF